MTLCSNKIIKYARILDVVMSLVMLLIGVVYHIPFLWAGSVLLLGLTALNYQKWLVLKIMGKPSCKN